jgi:hypothetical protein
MGKVSGAFLTFRIPPVAGRGKGCFFGILFENFGIEFDYIIDIKMSPVSEGNTAFSSAGTGKNGQYGIKSKDESYDSWNCCDRPGRLQGMRVVHYGVSPELPWVVRSSERARVPLREADGRYLYGMRELRDRLSRFGHHGVP